MAVDKFFLLFKNQLNQLLVVTTNPFNIWAVLSLQLLIGNQRQFLDSCLTSCRSSWNLELLTK